MPTLLIDMPGGIAGDMLLAALLDLGGDLEAMQRDLAVLLLGKIGITSERITVSGIAAVRVDVEAEKQAHWIGASPTLKQHPPHRHYREIRDLLDKAPLAARVKARAQKVFRTLAEAEGSVHGVPPEDVHFHEVGAVDAIVDVVGCCLLMEQLHIDRVIAAPLTPGEGHVDCAHGRMPVPVPAVAAMLASFQAPQRRTGRETGELTTPTGCALVVALADRFLQTGEHFNLTVMKIGHGAGHKTIPGLFNAVRCSLAQESADVATEEIAELRCQVDDATGEQLAVLVQDLIDAGAHDAYLTPVIMKKGRPGHEITVICPAASQAQLRNLLLNSSPTIGVRYQSLLRQVLKRRVDTVTVRGQAVAMKVVTTPDGSERAKPEAEAVAAAAKKLKLSFQAIQSEALQVWAAKSPKT